MAAGYRKIPFTRFALAAVVISLPAMLLEQTGRARWAWAYVGLIILMMVVFYADGLSKAASFTSSMLKKG